MNRSLNVRWLTRNAWAAVGALSILSACFGTTSAMATEPAAAAAEKEAVAQPAPSDEAMLRWIDELGSPSHAVRGEAQAELMRAGATALEEVAAAAGSANPEVRVRSVDILRRHSMGDDAALSSAAQTLLDALSTSPDMGVARAAQAALATNARRRAADAAAKVDSRMIARGRGGLIFVRPPVVARAVAVKRVAVGRSVSVSVSNGKRTIVAKNGDRRVEISDGGDDGIKMTITDKVDGKEKKESFAAEDAKELKDKHAEAYKEYAKYAKDGGGGVIRRSIVEILGEKALDGAKGEKKAGKLPLKGPAADAAPARVPPPKQPPLNHVDVPDARPRR